MGRSSTGVWTNRESLRLELSFLIKSRYIIKGAGVKGILNWSNQAGENTGSAEIMSHYLEGEAWIEISFAYKNNRAETVEVKQRIALSLQPSNLGQGELLYFICPMTGRRCRVLYMTYGVKSFYSRQAYLHRWNKRIYYSSQLSSKLSKERDRYWRLEEILEKDSQKRAAKDYNGKATRRKLWKMKTLCKSRRAGLLMWSPENLPRALREAL